jgi:hypothetical protein
VNWDIRCAFRVPLQLFFSAPLAPVNIKYARQAGRKACGSSFKNWPLKLSDLKGNWSDYTIITWQKYGVNQKQYLLNIVNFGIFFLMINDDSNRAQENDVVTKLDQRMSTD